MLRLVALVAVALGVWRVLVSRAAVPGTTASEPWERNPLSPKLAVVPEPPVVAGWADPVDGSCVPGYPVKAKLGSGIYHVPGGLSYGRTIPDRCYVTPAAAEADGLRAAKR